jgi:transcriptional regulator with XRE-family HTH domain
MKYSSVIAFLLTYTYNDFRGGTMRNEEVGKLLKELRLKHKLTQAELANRVGVTYQAVSRWEKGMNTPNLDTLLALKNIYGISVDELLLNQQTMKKVEEVTNPVIYEQKHWVLRLLLFPVLIFFLFLLALQFFLFFQPQYVSVTYAIFFTVLLLLPLYIFKFKKRQNAFIISLSVLSLISFIIFIIKPHYFMLDDVPYIKEIKSIKIDQPIWNVFQEITPFVKDEKEYLFGYHMGRDDFLIYDLQKPLKEMRTILSTSGIPIEQAVMIEDDIYFISGDGSFDQSSTLYQINRITGQMTELETFSSDYRIFTDKMNLYFLSGYGTAGIHDSVWIWNGFGLDKVIDFNYFVEKIIYNPHFRAFFVSMYRMDSQLQANIHIYDDTFLFQHEVFMTHQVDDIEVNLFWNRVGTTFNGEIVILMYNNPTYTGIYDQLGLFHFTGNMYVKNNGEIYTWDFAEHHINGIVAKNWNVGYARQLYAIGGGHIHLSISADELSLYQRVDTNGIEQFIPILARVLMLLISIPLIALIFAYGITVKKDFPQKQLSSPHEDTISELHPKK